MEPLLRFSEDPGYTVCTRIIVKQRWKISQIYQNRTNSSDLITKIQVSSRLLNVCFALPELLGLPSQTAGKGSAGGRWRAYRHRCADEAAGALAYLGAWWNLVTEMAEDAEEAEDLPGSDGINLKNQRKMGNFLA